MTRKPIQFMFGDGFGDHPTVMHGKALEEGFSTMGPHGEGFWIYLGFSRRLLFSRHSYVDRVFDMDRRQTPPWIFIRMTWRPPIEGMTKADRRAWPSGRTP